MRAIRYVADVQGLGQGGQRAAKRLGALGGALGGARGEQWAPPENTYAKKKKKKKMAMAMVRLCLGLCRRVHDHDL